VRTTIAAAAGREAEAAAALPFLECLDMTTTAEEEEDRFNDDDFCNGTPCGARRTLSCRSASAFAPWTVVSHFAHKYASSAAQYHRALCIPHTSHARLALPAIAIAVACTLLVVMIIFFFFVAISLPDLCSHARALSQSLYSRPNYVDLLSPLPKRSQIRLHVILQIRHSLDYEGASGTAMRVHIIVLPNFHGALARAINQSINRASSSSN
jgi:hypothetical protein